jgi:hypothetical protein
MNDELLTMVERDVVSWPGVTKETKRGWAGPGRLLGSASHRLQVRP